MRPDTHICYSLEEAAGQLQLSESILLRLSQFFRVPSDAYEDVGSMSFKADPVFYDAEMAFFLEVKKRLLAGETLQQLKKNMPRLKKSFPQPDILKENPSKTSAQPRKQGLASPSLRSGTPLSNTLNSLNRRQLDLPHRQERPQPELPPQQSQPVVSSELRELPGDDHMLSRVADDHFKQYKKKNGGFGLKKVFQKLLNDLGMTDAQGIEDFEMFHPQQSSQQVPYAETVSPQPQSTIEQPSLPRGRQVEHVYEPPKPRELRQADTSEQDYSSYESHADELTSPLEFISTNNAARGQEPHASTRPYQLSEQVIHAARNLRHQAAERYSDDNSQRLR